MRIHFPAFIFVSAAISVFASAGTVPNGIQRIVGGEAFWDGGSVILEFIDSEQTSWQAYLNKSLSEKKKERMDSITVTKLCNGFGDNIIHQEGKLLEKDSKEEKQFLSCLAEAIEEERVEDEHALEMAKEFLKKKSESNKAPQTTRASARV